MNKIKLLIIIFTCITCITGLVSCTYDYFDDETNYLVYVPEVMDNSIDNCRVMIYDAAGTLVKERYATHPWNENALIKTGLFGFRLPAGDYKVYCYTNTDSFSFSGVDQLSTSAFTLNTIEGETDYYVQPSNISHQIYNRTIVHPGLLITDTAKVAPYLGTIHVRFKQIPLTAAELSGIAKVKLHAVGAATVQYLEEETLTSRTSDTSTMLGMNELLSPATAALVETSHVYMPTVNDGKIMQLVYSFLDSSDAVIKTIIVDFSDRSTGLVSRQLLSGETVILDVDTYLTSGAHLVGWSANINGGGNTDLE